MLVTKQLTILGDTEKSYESIPIHQAKQRGLIGLLASHKDNYAINDPKSFFN